MTDRMCNRYSGWTCKTRAAEPVDHFVDDTNCGGAGAPCPNSDCSWWAGKGPIALQFEGKPFRVVQPWGRDARNESTTLGSYSTSDAAFNAIDAMVNQMVRAGAPSDVVELIVLDSDGHRATRPGAH